MPEWYTHVLFALILADVLRLNRLLVVIGALIPDIILKIELLWTLFAIPENTEWALVPFHSPSGAILVGVFAATFFVKDKTKVFGLFMIGVISHFALDQLLNKHYIVGQTFFFFPFSWLYVEYGLLWSDEFYITAFVMTIIAVLYFLFRPFLRVDANI